MLRYLVGPSSRYVVSIAEIAEYGIDRRMTNRLVAGVRLQVTLGHVCFMCRVVYQNSVPGLILGWP